MAERLKIEGNFLIIFEGGNPSNEYVNVQRAKVTPRYTPDDKVEFLIDGLKQGYDTVIFDCTTILDDRTRLVFNSVAELKTFLSKNLGGSCDYMDSLGFVLVGTKSDFPDPVSGVITLLDSYTYYITAHIDLNGDRIVSGNNTTILGASSENNTATNNVLVTDLNAIID